MADGDEATAPRGSVPEFHAYQPTRLAAGSGIADAVGRYAATYGVRAVVVAGESHARSSGLLVRTLAALKVEGITTQVLEGVGPNPSVAVVDAGATLARTWRADHVVAIGGGSVIDVAKAIATSAAASQARPFQDHLSGRRAPGLLVDAALPVVALPTLPGSGSETNGTSVIIDDETGRKLSAHSDLAAPRIALLDPELVLDTDPQLLSPGLADGCCHALEAALSTGSSIASDAMAEQALRMLLRLGASPLELTAHRDHRAKLLLQAWWATNLAGQALTFAGSIVTHPLAHPISARLDARHGAAVAALEPAVLAVFADRFAAAGSLQKLAEWFGIRGGTDDADIALRGVLTRLGRLLGALDVRATVTELGVVDARIADVVRDARASGSRGLTNMPGREPTPEDLFRVLDVAQACGPTATVKRLLARVATTAPVQLSAQ